MNRKPSVSQLFFAPLNVGEATEPNFTGRSASFECGAVLRISLHVDAAQRITDAKFKAAGCSALVTAASILTSEVMNKTTGDAASMVQHSELFENQLGKVMTTRSECVALAYDALIDAIAQYSNSRRDEWEGDEALICTCFSVSERTIEREIRSNQLRTIGEVTAACNAGAGCRSCYPLIEDILGEVNRES